MSLLKANMIGHNQARWSRGCAYLLGLLGSAFLPDSLFGSLLHALCSILPQLEQLNLAPMHTAQLAQAVQQTLVSYSFA